MAEFSASADLEVTVDQQSIRSARRQIESGLGDVEVGLAPTGGGGAVGSRGPEPATVDLSRRQLGQQETLVELAIQRNDLLEDLRGQGGAGGAGGAGSTLLQVQGARSLLGGGIGAAAGTAAAGLGTAGAFGGILAGGALAGLAGRNFLQGQFGQESFGQTPIAGTSFTVEGTSGQVDPVLQIPEGFPPELQVPEGFPPQLDIPEGFPPELQVPAGFPPELQLPPGVQQIPDSIGIDVPPELRQLAGGQLDLGGSLDINAAIDLGIPSGGELQREVESIVQREFDNLVRSLGNVDLNNVLGG